MADEWGLKIWSVSDATDSVFSVTQEWACARREEVSGMLQGLRICQFAVMEEVEVTFSGGLTVVTGETGAGKSIVMDALSLLLGGRAEPDCVRTGADEATVEGTFRRTPLLGARLEELGLPDLGEELLVRRVVGRGGRSRAWVNGSLVTVGVLSRLMKGTVEIAGQHEHTALLDPAEHLGVLDREPGVETGRRAFDQAWEALRAVEAELLQLGGDDRQLTQRAEFLRFQLEELDRLDLQPGEEAVLEAAHRRLSSAERLFQVGAQAESLLAGQDGGAAELMHRALALLQEGGRLDEALVGRRESLTACVREVEQLARELGRYAAGAEGDPERRQLVEERLDSLRKLCRKHGRDGEGLRALREELRGELDRLERRHEEAARLGGERQKLRARAAEAASGLGVLRRKAAARLEARVQAGLSQLALGGARFAVQLGEAPLSGAGTDVVEFLFTANAGEPLRPLARVASGGEASRLMLALKRAGAGEAGPSACVLDEADTGVSGAVAEVVGRMIHELSEHRQVLCITHLPQVAAYADHHLRIVKEETGGRAVSHVVSLSDRESRTRELARMLAGVELTREALGAAEALVRSAARRPGGRAVRPGQRQRKAG